MISYYTDDTNLFVIICHGSLNNYIDGFSRDGFQLKNKPTASQSVPLTKKISKDENPIVPSGKENSNSAQLKSSFLSKFRKEPSSRVPLRESAKGNPILSDCYKWYQEGILLGREK